MGEHAQPHVLVLGTFSDVVERLWAAGATTSLICDGQVLHRHKGVGEHGSVTVTDGATDEELVAIAAGVHRVAPLTHAVSYDDATMVAAALIREELGLTGGEASSVVRAVHDKDRYRRALSGLGTAVPHRVVGGVDDVLEFGRAHGWPLVVKPVSGSGSAGVTLNVGPDDVAGALAWALEPRQGQSTTVMVEEQVDGALITVDTFSHEGVHHVTSVGYELVTRPFPVVMATGVPAPLTEDLRDVIVDAVTTALTLLGVATGPAHHELLLRPDGRPALVETQLRPGGELPELTRASSGLDVYEVWTQQILGGDPTPLLVREPEQRRSAIMLYPGADLDGRLLDILHLDQARAAPGVVHLDGSMGSGPELRRVRTIGDCEIAMLVGDETPARVLRRALAAMGKVRFRVRPDVQLPAPVLDH